MKKGLAFLVAFVATIFALSSCKNKEVKQESKATDSIEVTEDSVANDTVIFSDADPLFKAQIVYVNIDTVIKAYNLAKELEKVLKEKEQKSRSTLVRKQEALQKKALQFQKDYENGKFLTEIQLTGAQQELLKGEQEVNQLDQKLTKEMLDEQNRMNMRLRDSLNSVLKTYIDAGRYTMILANTEIASNVLMSKPEYNITKFVVEDLNARYVTTSSKK